MSTRREGLLDPILPLVETLAQALTRLMMNSKATSAKPMVYVCTHEPYHDNSDLIGVTTTLQQAMSLLGRPDARDWQIGDTANTANSGGCWYTTKAGEPVPQIREVALTVRKP